MKNVLPGFKKTALVSALMLATGSQAATINVDGVTCNFNDALTAANSDAATGGCTAGSGDDVLELPVGATLTLTAVGEVNSNVTINGNGSTLEPAVANRVLRVGYGGVAGSLIINDTTVQNGYEPTNFGGGIRAYDSYLGMNNSTFTNNTGGAVIFTRSSGYINNSSIISNIGATATYYGGGVSVASSSVVISNSTISNNSTQSANVGGGGVYMGNFYAASSLIIDNSTITGNSSSIRGGGISHQDYGNGASISMTNVTMAANVSNGNGGGLSNDAANITISQSLISGNNGLGGTEIDSAGGTITADDYNLFGLNSTSGVVGVTVGASDIVPTVAAITDILDVNLLDNGGPTPTHALVDGSPAIDAVPAASCASGFDQTGQVRPLDGDGDSTADCDVGAFENEAAANPDIIFKDGFDG